MAKQFLAENTARFTVAYDPEGLIAKQFKVMGMPSSYLIDRAGNVYATHIGFLEKDAPDIERNIKALLAK